MHKNVQTIQQERTNETQPGFHAFDVPGSKCRIHVLQTTLKITDSCLDAYPSIHVPLRITVVSCSTHQQLFKQELAPWSVTSEVSTSNPSFWLFLGPNNTTTRREDATSSYAPRKEGAELGHVVVGTRTHPLHRAAKRNTGQLLPCVAVLWTSQLRQLSLSLEKLLSEEVSENFARVRSLNWGLLYFSASYSQRARLTSTRFCSTR